ncbi:MAG: sulfate adenylyltransferase [Chloroflexi bacterium]|nr:MAG: sulfate adenylyltransferase [Chloroflexota bacterium]
MIKELEQESIFIIREAKSQFKNVGVLCSFGKDSVTLLHLISKAFPFKEIPFKIFHIDTELKLPEIYKFKEEIAQIYDIDVITVKNEEGIKNTSPSKDRFSCCMERKTKALQIALKTYKLDAIMTAIRRDELAERGIERFFSPRKKGKWEILRPKMKWESGDSPFEYLQDAEFSGWSLFRADFSDNQIDHYRIHPMLNWTELDVWKYIKQENLPVNPLYFAKHGKRFRSIGCSPCTKPIESNADSIDKIIREVESLKGVGERDGRSQDKEKIMRRLRALGYM